jgi:hypothetical protein
MDTCCGRMHHAKIKRPGATAKGVGEDGLEYILIQI